MPAFAFLGAGEFEPWTEPVDRALLERSPNPDGVVLVLPTAAAHEGEASFRRWGSMGLEHYGRLGIPAEVLPLRVREDAERDDLAARLDDAAFVFFSGGNPARLARALDGSAFWRRLRDGVRDGLPYAGCSAGVTVFAERTFDSDVTAFGDEVWAPGLAYVRKVVFAPHWDAVDRWFPGATDFILASVRDDETFVGLDERTAMLGDGSGWRVVGDGRIHVRRGDDHRTYGAGETFELRLDVER